ncbi:MAG: GxxExxY protein [Pseudomonadota bacterium]
MAQLIHKKLSYTVRGVMIDVYNQLGPQLPEKIYQKAITYGLRERGITCTPEKQFNVIYQSTLVGEYYVDHWLEKGKIILEIKVAPKIMPIHQAQTISYLKLTDADLAIIANFGAKSFEDKRLPNFIRDKTANFQWQPLGKDILYAQLTERIFEALHRVHFILGPGFIHRVYQQAMMIELQHQGLGYEHINKIQLYYNKHYLDVQPVQIIKVENQVLLGVFAISAIDEVMEVEMKTRLKYFKMKLGILANFHGEQLEFKMVRI